VRALIVLALAVAATGCGRRDAPSAGSGAAGSATPRIVTLSPSATEVVAALGATSELVGVDDYSKFPPEVAGLPKVGNFLQPNLEAIVRLRPTLVIADDVHADVARALADAGVATVSVPMHALPDVERALVDIGARIGRADAASNIVAEIEATLDAAHAEQPAKRPRVLAVIDHEVGGLGGLVAVGPGTWLDELLALAGGENVLAASGVRYPKISLEEVVRGQPDVILDVGPAAATAPWSAVDVPAVRAGRVRVLDAPYLMAPSPRLHEAIGAVRAAIK
jgi:iron complex transport system substrate-binding protein